MDQDPTLPGGVDDPGAYTDVEQQALTMAADLRDRVRRERAVVADLQAYLAGDRDAATPPI